MGRLNLLFLVVGLAIACAPVVTNAPDSPSAGSTMHEYALIFRTTGPVAPTDLRTRNAAARDWALALRERGVLRTASPLQDEGRVVRQHGVEPVSGTRAIASVLVIEAESLDAATALAQGHPGLAYGTEIEVRPVKAVGLPPAR